MSSQDGKSIDKKTIPDDLQSAVVLFQAERLAEAYRFLINLVKVNPQNTKI